MNTIPPPLAEGGALLLKGGIQMNKNLFPRFPPETKIGKTPMKITFHLLCWRPTAEITIRQWSLDHNGRLPDDIFSRHDVAPRKEPVDYANLRHPKLAGPEVDFKQREVSKDNALYLYDFKGSHYYAVRGFAQDREWLVIFGQGGVLETAFPPEETDDYLERRGFIFLGRIGEVLEWTA